MARRAPTDGGPAKAGDRPDRDRRGAETPLVRLAAPSPRAIVRIVVIVAACAAGFYLLWRLRLVVRLVAISVFVALVLMPIVDAVCARVRLPRAVVILGVYVILLATVVVVGYVVVPTVVHEVGALSRDAPQYAAALRRNEFFRTYDDRYHLTPTIVRQAHRLPELLAHSAGPLADVTVRAFGFVGQITTVLAIAFLLVFHGREYVDMALTFAGSRRQRFRDVLADIEQAVAGYTLGNIVISGLAALATWIVLSVLGVGYALSLGFVVGFFDLIPLVGATLGAIVVALFTVTVDFPTATIVWVVFIVLWQRFEDYVVQPAVYGKSLNVNPLVTIVAVLAGATLLGILGALLAIPTAAAIQIVLRAWWADRTAGSPPPT